jgi:hypothetical protein
MMSGKLNRPVPWWRRKFTLVIAALIVLTVLGVAHLVVTESESSALQARYFARVAANLKFRLDPGPSHSYSLSAKRPYDKRLGYSEMPAFLDRLRAKGYQIQAQARLSTTSPSGSRTATSPLPEKSQAGFARAGLSRRAAVQLNHPVHVYAKFNAIRRWWSTRCCSLKTASSST